MHESQINPGLKKVARPPRFSWRARQGAGFTLIEILIVIAIIGMITGVVVASFGQIMDAQDKPIERVFRDYVREARIQAATTKNVVYLSFNQASGEFILTERGKGQLEDFPEVDGDIEPSEWEIEFFPRLSATGAFGAPTDEPKYSEESIAHLVFHPSGISTAAKIEFREEDGYENTLTLDPFSSGPAPRKEDR